MPWETLEKENGETIKYKPLVSMICAFCNGKATAIQFEDGGYGMTHTVPYCSEFTVMEPDVFLRENRKIFQKDIDEKKFEPN